MVNRNDGALIDAFHAVSNRLLGYGGSRDPVTAVNINAVPRLGDESLTEIYRGYKLIQKIIDLLPEDANAKEILIHQGKSNIDTDSILSVWRNIEVNTVTHPMRGVATAFTEAGILSRLYGNAYIILGINDGQEDFSQPINEDNIQSIEWLAVRDRSQIKPMPNDRDRYQMTLDIRNQLPGNNQSTTQIHRSRLLRFSGKKLRGYMARNSERAYEDDSIIQSLFNEFVAFVTGVSSGSSMLNSHSVFKYKLNGLARLTTQQNSDELRNRFRAILTGLSSIKGLVFDAQNEDAEFINRTYGGVNDVMVALRDVFVAVSDMPHSMLFGSPTGGAFSESGASDRYTWANTIERYQRNELLANHAELLRLTCLAKNSPTKGIYPDDLSIAYPSALQLTRKELAELKKLNAETDQIYMRSGVLVPAETRERFGGAEYTDEITLIDGVNVDTQPIKKTTTQPSINKDSVSIEGNKIRVMGALLPLSEYGEDVSDEPTIED